MLGNNVGVQGGAGGRKGRGGKGGLARRIPPVALSVCIACIILLAVLLGAVAIALEDWMSVTRTVGGVSLDVTYGLFNFCSGNTCTSWVDAFQNASCPDIETPRLLVLILGIAGLALALLALCCILPAICLWWVTLCGGCLLALAFLLVTAAVLLYALLVVGGDVDCTLPFVGANPAPLCPDCSLGVAWFLLLASSILLLLALCLSYCLCFLARRGRKMKGGGRIPIGAPPVTMGCPVPCGTPLSGGPLVCGGSPCKMPCPPSPCGPCGVCPCSGPCMCPGRPPVPVCSTGPIPCPPCGGTPCGGTPCGPICGTPCGPCGPYRPCGPC